MLASIVLFVLSIGLNLLAGYIGFLSGTGKNDRKKVFNRIKRKFLPLGGLSLAWLILTVIYFSSSKAIQDREQEQGQTKLMTNIANALGKYHLKYDSSQQRIIQVLHDSLRTSTTVINNSPAEPDFNFCTSDALEISKLTSDTLELKVRVCNYGAPSYDVDTKAIVLVKFTKGNWSKLIEYRLILADKLSVDQALIRRFILTYSNDTLNKLYLLGTGTYEDLKGKKQVFKVILVYNFETKTKGYPNEYDADLDTVKSMFKYLK